MDMNIDQYAQKIRHIDPNSHKGQNGKVLVVGGSELFHAASRWALDVVSSMVDMVFYSSVPENNTLIAQAKKEFWSGVVIPRGEIENYIEEADVILIGPGMTRDEDDHEHSTLNNQYSIPTAKQWNSDTFAITNYLLSTYPTKKWVIDAGALQMINPFLLNTKCIITPHIGEYERLLKKISPDQLLENNVTVLLKGKTDLISSKDRNERIEGGNAGMTKGGTGDALAGLVAGLYAFTDDPFAAAVVGSYVNKKAGDTLFEQFGPFFRTNQLVEQIPKTLKHTLQY